MRRASAWLAAVLLPISIGAVFIGAAVSAQDRQQPFRAGVDLIAVDAEVFDTNGKPVEGLGPADFQVTVDGMARRVASATFVDYVHSNSTLASTLQLPGAAASGQLASVRAAGRPGRLFVLVVDCSTFNAHEARPVLETAKRFLAALPPDDLVGLLAFPVGPALEPTADRKRVIAALDEISGQKIYELDKLRPSELVAMANFLARHPDDDLPGCAIDPHDGIPKCEGDMTIQGQEMIALSEFQVASTASHLQRLMQGMEPIQGRKHVVLISAGQPTNDRGGPRLDVGDLARQAGEWAARANATIDSLFIDRTMTSLNLAERRTPPRTYTNLIRDRLVLQQVLDQYADASGGTVFRITGGAGEYAFDQIARQTSAFYLLGVEAVTSDTDGKLHQLAVNVRAPGATIRARQWFAVPRGGSSAAAPDPFAGWDLTAAAEPLQLDALAFRNVAPGEGAAVALVVGRSASPDASSEHVEIVAVATETGSTRVADQQRAVVNFTWTPGASRDYEVLSRLAVRPGRYEVRVGARLDPQRTGVATTTIDVPDFSVDPVSLSGLALFTARRNAVGQPDAIQGLLPAAPTSRRSFETADRVKAFLRVYQGEAVTPASATVTMRVADAAGAIVSSDETTIDAAAFEADRSADYATDLPIVDLQPGTYTLTIEAQADGRTATRTLTFTVR